MNIKQLSWKEASVALVAATAVGISVPAVQSQDRSTIKIDGSSTVYPITEAVAEEYQQQTRGATRVTVGISGTGGGFEKFCSSDASVRTDISNASRPIKASEKEACAAAGVEFIEIPVAYDAITVVVNPSNPIDAMTTAELEQIWSPDSQGTVSNWNQIDPSWPNAELKLYGPGADSGTFDYFTDAIVGEEGASRADYTPSEDDNVLVQGVASNPTALGYFGYSYYENNKDQLKAIAIDAGNGPVEPSLETVRDGSYPLARPIFIYVNSESAAQPEVAEFVNYYLDNATRLATAVSAVPLSEADYADSKLRFQNGEVGSAY